jgi:hypothetical protein
MSHHTEERDDGYPPVTVHRRVRVGDEVRVTAEGIHRGRVGIVTSLSEWNAMVNLDGERAWLLKSRLEPTQPRQRPGEKSEDIKARLGVPTLERRAQDPTSPANIPEWADFGEKPPYLVAVPSQAQRTSSLAEWDRAESNGERIGHNRAVVAIQRTLAAETRRIRERGISETDEAYLEGIERALDVVREMGEAHRG